MLRHIYIRTNKTASYCLYPIEFAEVIKCSQEVAISGILCLVYVTAVPRLICNNCVSRSEEESSGSENISC